MRFALYIGIVMVVVANAATLTLAQEDNRMFYIKVTKATELQGQFVDVDEFKVATAFGEVTIPIDKIEAIKMHAGNDDSAVIAFTNGDLITGKISVDEFQLKTNWGKAHIKSASIESISTTEFGRFYTDPNGGGWRYSRGNAVPQPNNMVPPRDGQFQRQFQGSGTNFSN